MKNFTQLDFLWKKFYIFVKILFEDLDSDFSSRSSFLSNLSLVIFFYFNLSFICTKKSLFNVIS